MVRSLLALALGLVLGAGALPERAVYAASDHASFVAAPPHVEPSVGAVPVPVPDAAPVAVVDLDSDLQPDLDCHTGSRYLLSDRPLLL